MKRKTSGELILISLIIIFILNIFSIPIQAYNNAPYKSNSETPDKPKYYNFFDTGLGTFKISHYSTHDWIADAALRYLILESPDWDWLLDDEQNQNPKWIDKYSDGVKHYPVRSYVSFLFATQMPDMDPGKQDKARPHKHPRKINLWEQEGELIGNGDGTGVWVGKWYHQTLHYIPIPIGSEIFMAPKLPSGAGSQKATWYAWKTSNKAIECLTNQELNDNNQYEIWSKPEAAACWFGVMSHFIADLASPAHLIGQGDGYYPSSPSFHTWFEDQVSKFTLWDEKLAGPRGFYSKTNFFNIDISQISDEITPIRPDLAAIIASERVISNSYKYIDEGGLFIEKGNQEQENLIDRKVSTYWEWDTVGKERNSVQEIIPGGLNFKQYYDRVEYLLNIAIYFTAAAMKWTMNKVMKGKQPNYDKWAETQFKDKNPDQEMPVDNPPSLDKSDESKYMRYTFKDSFVLLAPFFALTFVSMTVIIIFEKIVA